MLAAICIVNVSAIVRESVHTAAFMLKKKIDSDGFIRCRVSSNRVRFARALR